MSTVGGSLKKLNIVHSYKTLLYPTASKSLLQSSAFVAKSGAQSLMFKKRSDKKRNVFGRPGGGCNPSQTKLGINVVMEDRARSCTSKTFGGLMHSFDARER